MGIWRARPVFVSSTFQDMQAERDHLRTHVFPELEERLRARRVHLEWVDLRLGIVTASQAAEHAREREVLKVCLAEVRRCRPFLIVLLGDRYGWVPSPDRIAAVAMEEGLGSEVVGCSVTDLEIQVGMLSPPHQRQRCFFYFRAPLPYGEMPPDVAATYTDAHGTEPTAKERTERLAAMKQRIEAALPDRVRHYAVNWDTERSRVTDLEAWGRIVLEDIWGGLAEEEAAAETEIPWTQAERNALEDFAADRARDFVGRERILAYLTRLALSPTRESMAQGACVTGDPGSGKSALFGELYQRLKKTDALVLAHAAGASPQSTSVDAMLRRFIEELNSALGADPIPLDSVTAPTLETTFASLLGKLAARRRVVLLVDALDEFERTPRGRFLTWLPRRWSANAKFIATAVQGDGSRTLAERSGIEMVAMPPLDAGEARHIAKAICARYHRALEPEVLEALLARSTPAGLACANPLWLAIAVEELNLLDADDFELARGSYSGAPAERLRSLMLNIVGALQIDVPALYRVTFDRAQELFGARFAQAFLGLIGLSRAGWRESDFRALLPRLSKENWDGLRFAALRRFFRGQIGQRGVLGQWDFNHAQMRAASRALLAETGAGEAHVHAVIVEHLLSLGPDDPLRQTEAMVHLLGSEDWGRAAAYYGDASLSDAAIQSATRVLAESVLAETPGDPATATRTATRLLDDMGLVDCIREEVARRFLHFLIEALDGHTIDVRMTIIRRAQEVFRQLLAAHAGNAQLLTDLSVGQNKAGRLLKAVGRREEALAAYHDALTTFEALAAAEGRNHLPQYGLSICHQNIGDVLFEGSRLEDALAAYERSLAIDSKLAASDVAGHEWQLSLGTAHERIGRVLMASGRREEALEAYRASNEIMRVLLAADPENAEWQGALAGSLHGIGECLTASGSSQEALAAYRESLAIAEKLVAADPEDTDRQRDLSVSYERIGEVLFLTTQPEAGRAAYEESLAIREKLVAADPGNAESQRDLANSLERIADTYDFVGRSRETLEAYERGIVILENLVAADPGNREWQRGLSLSQLKLGDVQAAVGRREEALATYQKSLTICERLAAEDGEDARLLRQLSKSGISMGDALGDLGRREEALAVYERSLAIREKLAAVDAGNAEWQNDVSVAHNRLGNVLAAAGKGEEALVAYRRSLAIMKGLADADPENAMLQFNMAIGHERIANLLWTTRTEEALDEYRAEIAIHERLATSHPGVPRWEDSLLQGYEKLRDRLASRDTRQSEWRRELLLRHGQIGDLHARAGRLGNALAAYRQQLALAEALADAHPEDLYRLRDLSVSYCAIGDMLGAMGKGEEALVAFQKDLAIAEKLAAEDPGNEDWQWDLSLSHSRVGDGLLATRRNEEALEAFRKSVTIREKLTEEQPDNVHWQRGLAVSYNKVANVLIAANRQEEALDACRQLLAIAARLVAAHPGNADWQRGLAQSYEKVGVVLLALGRREEALAAHQHSQAISAAVPTRNSLSRHPGVDDLF
jgi:tetratricopeptide (TPR) repeat protein